jgi:hypothetical protein
MPGDDEIQRLDDIHEITQLKASYCRFVDTKDWESWGNLLVDDYYFDSDGGIYEGRDNVVNFVRTALGEAMTVHHVHSPEITFTGPDTAHGIWPMYDYVRIPGEGGSEFVLHGYGWYEEDYVRTSDGWRLSRCVEKRQRVDTEGAVPISVAELDRS